MKKKILIFGKGFIGTKLQQYLECDISDRRIFQTQDIIDEIIKYEADVIINCIGYTGENNVDDCEKNNLSINKTIVLNTFIPILFLEAATRMGVKLVHISSGCMYEYDYERDKPIEESKKPDYYKLYYSRSKIYAERILGNDDGNEALVLRIRIPLDDEPTSKNILSKLIRYKKIINVPNSVTYIPDFLEATEYLIDIDAKGIYNVLNEGGLYYKDLLDEYKKYHPEFEYQEIKASELKTPRTNLIMSTKKLQNAGFKVRPINEVIKECVKKYVTY